MSVGSSTWSRERSRYSPQIGRIRRGSSELPHLLGGVDRVGEILGVKVRESQRKFVETRVKMGRPTGSEERW